MAKLFAELFDLLDFPIRRVAQLAALLLAFAAIALPGTFSHALQLYAAHEAEMIVRELKLGLHPQPLPSPGAPGVLRPRTDVGPVPK